MDTVIDHDARLPVERGTRLKFVDEARKEIEYKRSQWKS